VIILVTAPVQQAVWSRDLLCPDASLHPRIQPGDMLCVRLLYHRAPCVLLKYLDIPDQHAWCGAPLPLVTSYPPLVSMYVLRVSYVQHNVRHGLLLLLICFLSTSRCFNNRVAAIFTLGMVRPARVSDELCRSIKTSKAAGGASKDIVVPVLSSSDNVLTM
jgi:hypothetical protein